MIPFSVCFSNDSIKFDFKKGEVAYEFSESKEKINHLLFMDDLKLYSRSERGLNSLLQTVHVLTEDIRMELQVFRNFRSR